MSRLIAIIAGVILLLVAAVVALPFIIPAETYKPRLVELVKAQTGRDLAIDGPISFSFFPQIALNVKDARFSNASWGKDPEMVAMKELRATLKIMPLFRGEVEVGSFVLVDPVIHLEVRRDGTPNWQFTPPASAESAAPADAGADSSSGDNGYSVKQVRLGDISISNGTASYSNAQTGAAFALSDVNVDVSLPSLDDQLAVDGSAVWQGDKVAINLTADRPRAFIEGGKSNVDLAVSAPKVNASYKGSMQTLGGVAFGGDVDLSVPSVRDLAGWVGSPLPAGDGFGPLSIKGHAEGTDSNQRFSKAQIAFDGMNATGDMSVNTAGRRPSIKGQLALDKIDVNTYLGSPSSGGGSGGEGSSGGSGSAAGSGWSDEPIDMSGLKAVDADLSLSAEKILARDLTIGASALRLTLNNGLLKANLSKLSLYDGAGSGNLTLNGASATPQMAASFAIKGVSANPLLTDLAKFSRLEGKSAINFDVTSAGRSQRAMVSALNGKGAMTFTNGKIKGINIAGLVRNVLGASATGWQTGGSQDTDFSELGGTFTIANGILSNNDLKMLSPLIRITGAGTVNMPAQTLKYRVQPKLAATLEGQGGSVDAKGIEVPIIVEGPWSSPRFRPDLESMLKDPQSTIDTINTLKKDGGKGLINSLLGKPSGDAAPAEGDAATTEETAPKQVKPEDVLKGLFGR
ncbi:MAG: AsmA family protein [Rhizobiales bacterium]|nr:AsmA family protein [Hyphomicrobiales bacterium]